MVALAVVFSGLIGMMTIPSAFVFAANIDGTAGDDTLNGTDEADTINGFEGNDIIFGEGGDDTLDGGKGDDEIRGGDGIDEIKDGNSDPLTGDADYGNKVYGGSGNDNIDVGIDYTRSDFYYVYGEDGADYIEVVSNAFIRGGPDDDTIYCTALNECPINGDEGNDEIHVQLYDVGTAVYGGSGNDEIYFNGGGGTQYGDDGNDYVFVDGGGGDLKGGEGDDILEASGGSNFYNGGLGADNFKCSPGSDDIVEDYNPGEGDIVSASCETVQGTTS
jgi:Ca2+-binding RTX toxin-like protein